MSSRGSYSGRSHGVGSSSQADALHAACPTATASECQRFGTAFSQSPQLAVQLLKSLLEWKIKHGLFLAQESNATAHLENEDWRRAMLQAAHLPPHQQLQRGNNSSCGSEVSPTKLSDEFGKALASSTTTTTPPARINRLFQRKHIGSRGKASCHSALERMSNTPVILAPYSSTAAMTCKSGHRIVYVLPARLDVKGVDAETYTTTFALCLYRILHRSTIATAATTCAHGNFDNADQFDGCDPLLTVLVDCRAGCGWPNAPVYHMIALIRHCASALHRLFPGVVHRVVLFPIPAFACTAWTIVAPLLDPAVRKCVTLLAGPSTSYHAPVPSSLLGCVDAAVVQILEKLRVAAFVDEDE